MRWVALAFVLMPIVLLGLALGISAKQEIEGAAAVKRISSYAVGMRRGKQTPV
jgi:hypothetical protein